MTVNMDLPAMEGTWEELLAHSDQFAGRRFRLLPLTPSESGAEYAAFPEGETLDKVLAPFLADMDGRQVDAKEVVAPDGLKRRKQDISDLVAAKFRRQGFDV